MHESVVNHFSLSVNNDATKYLVNPGGLHFSLIKASELAEITWISDEARKRSPYG